MDTDQQRGPSPPDATGQASDLTAYETFSRPEWAALRASTPLALSEADLVELRGINEQVSLADVTEIYLPLSRLLNLHYRSARHLSGVKDEFLGRQVARRPYVVAISGSVAVGKSTFARVLRAVLAHWQDHPHVALVTTDGFLHPNAVLEARGLMARKGFPESYDRRRMLRFLADIKAGVAEVAAPVYSHEAYNILPGVEERVCQPDILIFEGLNVLQTGGVDERSGADREEPRGGQCPGLMVSDFFDFSIYVDADVRHIEHWYVQRFMSLQRSVFQNPTSYFHHYRDLSEADAVRTARRIWMQINLRNLLENIQPTRERADLILTKRLDHGFDQVRLRQV